MIIPILSGKLIDEVIENNRVQLLVPILLAMIGATLIRTVTRYIYQMFYEHVGQDAQFEIRQDMYKNYKSLILTFSIIIE